ncbi:MAG: hypothetical protein WCS56_05775 [Bacilli bacterium]
MNSVFKYNQDYQEAITEDPQGTMNFIQQEREKALKSYSSNDTIKYCAICGEPMIKGSIAYYEGFHIDNCI